MFLRGCVYGDDDFRADSAHLSSRDANPQRIELRKSTSSASIDMKILELLKSHLIWFCPWLHLEAPAALAYSFFRWLGSSSFGTQNRPPCDACSFVHYRRTAPVGFLLAIWAEAMGRWQMLRRGGMDLDRAACKCTAYLQMQRVSPDVEPSLWSVWA
jgi:hypothetical protein